MEKRMLIILLAAVIMPMAYAATYYVSPAGNNPWPQCTDVNVPCSWQTGMQNAKSGDTVYFRGGTYNVRPCYVQEPYIPGIYPCNDGTPGNPITLSSYPGETAIIHNPHTSDLEFTNACGQECGNNFGQQWAGAVLGAYENSYVTISGFKVTGTGLGGSVYIDHSDHVAVENCEIVGVNRPKYYNSADTGNWDGIRFSNTQDCVFRNNLVHGFMLTGSEPGSDHACGFKAFHAARTDVHHNTFYECDSGIVDKDDGRNNDYHHNFVYGLDGSEGESTGIRIGGMTSAGFSHVSVFNNIVIMTPGIDGAITFSSDSFEGSYSYAYNNLVYDPNGFGAGMGAAYRGYLHKYWWNNMIYGSNGGYLNEGSGAKGLPDFLDYNNYHLTSDWETNLYASDSASFSTLESWKSSGKLVERGNPDIHSTSENPRLSNLAEANTQEDFRLTSLTPASIIYGGRGGSFESYIGSWNPGIRMWIGYCPQGIGQCDVCGNADGFCNPESQVCGDGKCVTGETCASCAADCSACPCNSNWVCSDWGLCTGNLRSRTCTDSSNCGVSSGKPAETESCSASASECANWQSLHPDWLHCNDFETQQDLTAYDDYSTNNFAVSNADAYQGSYSLRQHYDAGQVDAGWISWFYCDTLGQNQGGCYDDIYMRWYHKFEPGFESVPPKMARITSIGPDWDKRFGVYYWVSDDKQLVADVHVPYTSQANSAGWLLTESGFYFTGSNIGRWICNEMEVKKNSPGQANGAIRYWVDGNLVVDMSNMDLVGSTSYNFNNAMLDTYWNGGSPKAQNRYYDNWVISKSRIGCLGSGQPPVQKCTEADTDNSNSISIGELNAYIARWKSGQAGLSPLMEVIGKWKKGC